ncbi:MAG: class I SAM-dependent methyltransferase [Patescibacteria group bacterium]|nr:class I SAM-dependent methyltransferase [Patescibacteria group bacterium]
MENNNGFLQPTEILKQIDIRNNMHIADFGCGNGYFSIPMAKIAEQGHVYALDVIKDTLEAVESKAELENISNIETIHCNLENLNGSKLDNESIDLVLLRNILFQSQKKSEIVKEAKRVLKDNNTLVLVEWIKDSSLAPKDGWLISKEEAQQLVKLEGFEFEKELKIDNHHYGLIFRK